LDLLSTPAVLITHDREPLSLCAHCKKSRAASSITVGRTHSVAANSENNHIFVPVTGVGVKVFSESDDQEGQSGK
jgi:hypothetical protein